jgi:hypothetical protein
MSNAHQSSQRRRCNVVTLAAILASLGLPACSGQTASAPAAPNPDQAAGMVLHFYRDVAAGGLGAMTDLHGIVSPAFYQKHASSWNAQYGFIASPRIQIRGIHGRTVGYTLDYATPLNGWRLYSQRVGAWNLAYTNNHWLLDSDTWNHVRVVAVRDNYGHLVTVHEVDPVGQREFVYRGSTYALYGEGWRRIAMAHGMPGAPGAVASYRHGAGGPATGGYSAHATAGYSAHAGASAAQEPRVASESTSSVKPAAAHHHANRAARTEPKTNERMQRS